MSIFFRSCLIDAMSSGGNLPVVRRGPCLIYAALPAETNSVFLHLKMDGWKTRTFPFEKWRNLAGALVSGGVFC